MTSGTTYHNVIFNLPGDDELIEIELCIIPRLGEIVLLDTPHQAHKVVGVFNDIHKRSGLFGKMGMYINRITVVLEQA